MSAAMPVVVLTALGVLLLANWRDGRLDLYVHPSFVPVVAMTGAALLLLAAVRCWALVRRILSGGSDHVHGGPAWALALLALAVVVGAILPARPLGSLMAEGQAAELPPPALLALTDETEGWTLLEWAQALNGGVQRERLVGRRVSVVGFVHRPRAGRAPGEIRVARFVVRCCAADGLAVSLPVRHADADAMATDVWVRVEGVLRLTDDAGSPVPFVEADRLTPVPVPDVPYLTPS